MSIIDRIEVMAVGPDVPRTTWASMPPQYMALTVARIWDSDGNEGVAATQTYAPSRFELSTYEHAATLATVIAGKEADDREARWHELRSLVLPGPPGAAAVLDNALWDLAARRAGLPLYRFLGGSRSSVEAYASTEQLETVNGYLELVQQLADQGFRAIKFHAWNEPQKDLTMLRAVGAKFGDGDVTFMHDAENRYDRESAIRVAIELDEMGYRWFEAPLVDYDVEGYRAIRERSRIPLVPHGLWITEPHEMVTYLRAAAWDAVRFDATSAGGITQCRRLCALADGFGLPVEPQSWGYSLIQAVNLHMSLSLANGSFFELPVPYEAYEYAVGNPIRIDAEGQVSAPNAPGIGLQIDWDRLRHDAIASFHVDRLGEVSSKKWSGD